MTFTVAGAEQPVRGATERPPRLRPPASTTSSSRRPGASSSSTGTSSTSRSPPRRSLRAGAGDQAFATVEAIVVPAGSLDPEGGIQAGEASWTSPPPRPARPATSRRTRSTPFSTTRTSAQLRGFPAIPRRWWSIRRRRAAGHEAGTEITQADVDAPSRLTQALADGGRRCPAGHAMASCTSTRAAEPTIEGSTTSSALATRPAPDHRHAGV